MMLKYILLGAFIFIVLFLHGEYMENLGKKKARKECKLIAVEVLK